LKTSIFWDVNPCSLLNVIQCFGGTCRLQKSVDFQWTTWPYIREDRTLHYHHCENHKSCLSVAISYHNSVSISSTVLSATIYQNLLKVNHFKSFSRHVSTKLVIIRCCGWGNCCLSVLMLSCWYTVPPVHVCVVILAVLCCLSCFHMLWKTFKVTSF
jgi:hypothetical protein